MTIHNMDGEAFRNHQCLVKDCTNETGGEESTSPVGIEYVICKPCLTMLREGQIDHTDSFLKDYELKGKPSE